MSGLKKKSLPDAKRRNVYIDGVTLKHLKELGDGNASAGIREAVKIAIKKTHAES